MMFIGIDPGKGGGIAVIVDGGYVVAYPMPETDREIWDLLLEYAPTAADKEANRCEVHAVIEQLNARPPGRKACFELGQSYGKLKLALVAAGIPFTEARPEVWQRAVGCPPAKNRTYAERKRLLRSRAQALYPQLDGKTTWWNAVADALLLVHFIKQTWIP